jgi:virginiamycin B lyase
VVTLAARGAACGLVAAICAASPATADIYWTNETTNTISRATNAGTVTDPSFITGATSPRGVAIDGAFIYWAHDGVAGDAPVGNIGQAPIDGSGTPDQTLVATAAAPQSVAVDNTRLYWAQPHPTMPANPGSVGRARLDGLFPAQNFVPTGSAPCGVASNADDVYWGNGGSPGSVGSSHGNFNVLQGFITATSDPCGVAQAVDRLYWTNRGSTSIGTAMQDGSVQNQNLIANTGAASDPCGIAVAGEHIYWTNRGSDTIGRADLDGGNQQDSFISGASVQDPCGIAVTPTAGPNPASLAFPDTEAGGVSAIQSFHIANTSSAVLAFSGAALDGADAGAFEITGNGCVNQVMPPGLGCIVNARFAPSAAGDYAAELRVTSAASNSPTVIPLSGHASPVTSPPPEPPPTDAKRHPRTLSIAERDKGPAELHGTLASETADCVAGQRVKLLRKRKGDDRRVGSDVTNERGRWAIDPGRDGRYYAVAAEGTLGDGAVCVGATSRTIRFG